MSWAGRRRTIFLSIILAVAAVVVGFFLYVAFYDAPTCSDGILNHDEQGIDCGGSCDLLCTDLVSQPIIHWSRSFEVTPGVYNSIAYVENPNASAGIDLAYTFKVFDEGNILIAERSGVTTLSPNGVTPVFEGGIQTGNLTAVRTFFEFDDNQTWMLANNLARSISVSESNFREGVSPRLSATISNNTVNQFSDLEVVAILYDAAGNAFATSRTVIPFLGPNDKKEIVFTWPREFVFSVARTEILPIVPSE